MAGPLGAGCGGVIMVPEGQLEPHLEKTSLLASWLTSLCSGNPGQDESDAVRVSQSAWVLVAKSQRLGAQAVQVHFHLLASSHCVRFRRAGEGQSCILTRALVLQGQGPTTRTPLNLVTSLLQRHPQWG